MAVSKTRAVLVILSTCPYLIQLCYASTLSYNFSDPASFSYGDLYFEGDACPGDTSVVMAKRYNGDVNSKAGRVLYKHPVHLWSNTTGEVTSFTTTFSFVMNGGEGGLAFFLRSYPSSLPLNSSTGARAGANSPGSDHRVVAVEFDTHGDLGWNPTMSPHIGADLNINFLEKKNSYKVIAGALVDGEPKIVRIDYSNTTNVLVVALGDFKTGTSLTLNTSVDLRRFLPQQVTMGFSANTATDSSQLVVREVLWWSFSTYLTEDNNQPKLIPARDALEEPSNSSTSPLSGPPAHRAKKSNRSLVVGIVVGTVLFAVIALILAFLCCLSRRTMTAAPPDSAYYFPQYAALESLHFRGRRFPFEVLSEATNNFSEDRLLGEEGNFGKFYKGDLTDFGIPVAAVKLLKIKSEPDFVEANYIDKLATISRERHGNIVQFLGWSTEKDNLCLVYEFVQNGSLHDHLYNSGRLLTWPMRYNIILCIGSGLEYLHEHDRHLTFLHRNIKPTNVMLDDEMNAKLGDFGLPQLFFQDDGEPASSSHVERYLAASQAYEDPEILLMGEATASSDVYSFGVVLLETACGQPPVVLQKDQAEANSLVHFAANSLVDFVWESQEKGSIFEACDKRLNGDFNREEMERVLLVGLWCAHPYGSQRPSISEAMSSLKLESPAPSLPPRMPIRLQTTADEGCTSPAGRTSPSAS